MTMWFYIDNDRLLADEREARQQLADATTRTQRIVAQRRLGSIIIEMGNRGITPSA